MTRVVFCDFYLIDLKKNYHSTLDRLRIKLHDMFWFTFYENIFSFTIQVTSFDILTLVKSSHFFNFLSKSLYQFHDLGHVSLNIGLVFYWVVLVSWSRSRIWQVNTIDSFLSLSFLIDFFFPVSSINIVFDWKLSSVICFG